MSEPEANTQSAAARRAAEAELRGLVAKHAAEHEKLVTAARRWLKRRLPTACEIVYDYRDCCVISCSPNEHGYEGVFAIRASADGVKLYLQRGKGLPDPAKLLKGTAQARWIQLEGAATLERPEVVSLVDEAIARNRVPFAPTGRGPIVVRSDTKKARPKRRSSK